MLAALIAIIIALTAAAGGTVVISDAAGPGDPLYGLDLTIEELQLQLSPDDQAQALELLKIAEERLDEALDAEDDESGAQALQGYQEALADLEELLSNSTLSPDALAAIEQARTALEAQLEAAGLPDTVDEFEVEIEVEGDEVKTELEVEVEDDDAEDEDDDAEDEDDDAEDEDDDAEDEDDDSDDGEDEDSDDSENDNSDDGEDDDSDDGEDDDSDDGEDDDSDDEDD